MFRSHYATEVLKQHAGPFGFSNLGAMVLYIDKDSPFHVFPVACSRAKIGTVQKVNRGADGEMVGW